MKLVLAIINHDDANTVTQALTKKGFSSTKLATTGGFLMAGNVTILIGVAGAAVLVGAVGHGGIDVLLVDVSDATIFVVDIERFERV